MLDRYTTGVVDRVSPEAPVPVVRVVNEKSLPGGAGNAMRNLRSLGMEVSACGRVGSDQAGFDLRKLLSLEGIDVGSLFEDSDIPTPQKNRILASSQQLLRVDHEEPTPLNRKIEEKFLEALPRLLQNVDVVAISDYAKGFCTEALLHGLIDHARAMSIPTIVDPKGIDFSRYRGATLIKPNYREASEAAQSSDLDLIADRLMAHVECETLVITRSEEGISLFEKKKRSDFPALFHEVRDVTGAGDTVLAILTAALSVGADLKLAMPLANLAAGIAVEHLGCYSVSNSDLQSAIH